MRIRLSYLLMLLVTLSAWANASEVLHIYPHQPWVAISQAQPDEWKMGDHLCVNRVGLDVACGEVIYVHASVAVAHLSYFRREVLSQSSDRKGFSSVELQFTNFQPERGDRVRLLNRDPKPEIRSLARELASTKDFGGTPFFKTDISGEKVEPYRPPVSLASAGMQFTSLFFQYQQSVTAHSAIGLKPIYLNQPIGDGSVKGLGAFITYDYYSDDEFRGIWFEAGIGGYQAHGSASGLSNTFFAPATNLMLGWRVGWKNNLTFGFAAGTQFLLASAIRELGVDFNGFLPGVTFDVGFRF